MSGSQSVLCHAGIRGGVHEGEDRRERGESFFYSFFRLTPDPFCLLLFPVCSTQAFPSPWSSVASASAIACELRSMPRRRSSRAPGQLQSGGRCSLSSLRKRAQWATDLMLSSTAGEQRSRAQRRNPGIAVANAAESYPRLRGPTTDVEEPQLQDGDPLSLREPTTLPTQDLVAPCEKTRLRVRTWEAAPACAAPTRQRP